MSDTGADLPTPEPDAPEQSSTTTEAAPSTTPARISRRGFLASIALALGIPLAAKAGVVVSEATAEVINKGIRQPNPEGKTKFQQGTELRNMGGKLPDPSKPTTGYNQYSSDRIDQIRKENAEDPYMVRATPRPTSPTSKPTR